MTLTEFIAYCPLPTLMIQVVERHESRKYSGGRNPSGELAYVIYGTDDEMLALGALLQTAPVIWAPESPKRVYRMTPSIEPAGRDWWEATVAYGPREKNEIGDWKISWDTTGGTQKITQSLETIGRHALHGQAPDHQGAIGVTKDSIEGVDIIVPQFKFSVNYIWDPTWIGDSYPLLMYALTGRVNSQPFWGFAPGEVLFLGGNGSTGRTDRCEIKYDFACSPNVTNLQAGGILIARKDGWHYVWFSYKEYVDTAAKALVKRPAYAYVERVYEPGNLAELGIG